MNVHLRYVASMTLSTGGNAVKQRDHRHPCYLDRRRGEPWNFHDRRGLAPAR